MSNPFDEDNTLYKYFVPSFDGKKLSGIYLLQVEGPKTPLLCVYGCKRNDSHFWLANNR
jgi:hypothetical protein